MFILILWLLPGAALKAQNIDSTKVKTQIDSTLSLSAMYGSKPVDLVDYVAKFLKVKAPEEKRSNRKVRFSLFPTQSGASGKTIVTTFNATFLLGDISNTNISTLYFIPYISFSNQYGFQLQPNIWLSKNSWNFTGEYFILNFPQNTWGLGGDSQEENELLVESNHLRVYQNALIKIVPNLAVGLGYALDRHYAIETGESQTITVVDSSKATTSSGIAFPVIFDNRRNSINPQQGIYAKLAVNLYLPGLGSDDKWQYLFCDVRKYFNLSDRKTSILAFRSYYWTILSGNAPYLDMPAVRWEPALGSASRGIRQGRYRSNAILYGEAEYRFGITANDFLGGVVFTNVTAPSRYDTQQFVYLHPAVGAGIRLKFNKYSRTNVTLDYGASKEFQSVYL
ncbi:MAG TPA: hypothetical protein VN249_07750, partial [Prolixibacteraceae bacterium]|nr:hypothetical protein [Prolixibacteraceae bacterium]